MGLDITAYTNLKPSNVTQLPDGNGDGYFKPGRAAEWSDHEWPGTGAGLEPQQVYEYEIGTEIRFRAGSYSGYNSWRNELAILAGFASAGAAWLKEGPYPFYELINFADNEGVIGPVTAAKLAKDFADNDEKAKTHPAPDRWDGWFYEVYQKWRQAFEAAAQNGAVEFH